MSKQKRMAYVITQGSYSDYRIIGVYSTCELAERAVALLNANTDDWYGEEPQIEEYELDVDDAIPPGRALYSVAMTFAGETLKVEKERRQLASNVSGPGAYGPVSDGWKSFHCRVIASDEKHAVKIANEHRSALIAGGHADQNGWIVLQNWRRVR